MLIRPPRAPLLVRVIAILAALAVAALIVHLVFTFGYYASGLAAHREDERRRRETPIRLRFEDPNAAPALEGGTAPGP